MSPFAQAIIAIITQLLASCPAPPTPAGLRNPSRKHDVMVCWKSLRSGMSLSDYRTGRAELDAIAAESTDEELQSLLAA